MLSLRTCIELKYVIEQWTQAEVDTVFHVFDLGAYIDFPTIPELNISKPKKTNILLGYLKLKDKKGPFTDSFQMDMLQYVVDQHYRNRKSWESSYEDSFTTNYESLANVLKLDGYVIKGKSIRKLLPEEIEEAKTESELVVLLDKFNFHTAKGHLQQARDNYSQGNWAGANAQFRPFVESLLIEICRKILPKNSCNDAAAAIGLLSNTANPPFLRPDLNEVDSSTCKTPFVIGLWKRLHPEGVHPGLSDEGDSTFRYHTTIVFAHYLLKRLESRNRLT